ncbi:MAG: membrane protein insertase YidC [Acidobacteria bacterium]|nr:membrane protein insertase YidC [Acidobacteriota bacterium]MCA1637904.1 membrane protein insertase YidC [Acidobacteriota bacterium]
MADNKQQTQSRFLLAALLSMAVLFGWSYFFAPQKPQTDNANTQQTVANTPAMPTPEVQQNFSNQQNVVSTPDNTPNKSITIKTPLYQVKLDSKGALATSWVLIKNKSSEGEKLLFADGSTENEKKPLELISPEGLNRSPREIPFRLSTGDQNIDNFINERNYQVSVNEENVELGDGQSKQIDYILKDEASDLEITKSFVFHADTYLTDLQVKLTKNGQPVPNTKLLIGASIGDHGIKFHNYYHIEPEAVVYINGGSQRHLAAAITDKKEDMGRLPVAGEINWAGVGDAYFAMAAIPAQKTQGLELRATKYEVQTEPFYDGIVSWITGSQKTNITRHLLTAYVPINADGSTNKIYTGTKDFFVLNQYNDILSQAVGRTIDIEDFVNFSNYDLIRAIVKPITVPILYALSFINSFTQNYGVAIIIFTFLFYSLLFPLRWSQSKSFKKAAGNAPKMKEMQEKLKEMQKKGIAADDPRMRELQMEQLKMTKDALPIGGCLPMLLQFPLLIALYTAVTISLGFRQASFLWLPDLSAGDPYHLLEFGFAFSMILSMKFTPQAAAITPEQQMQQKMMTYFMPVMMLWVMWSAPAGLLLYWFFGNIVSFVQQIIINRINKTNEPPTVEIVQTVPKNAKKVKPNLSTS